MELGVAGMIKTKHIISGGRIDNAINNWLEYNPDAEVIEIKFSTSAHGDSKYDSFMSEALIIYRKE